MAAPPAKSTAPTIGGKERQGRSEEGDEHGQGADGSPQEQVGDAERGADHGHQQCLHPGQDQLRAEEAAEGANDAAFEEVRLVAVAPRDRRAEAHEDARRVHQHVERDDDDQAAVIPAPQS